LTFELIDNTYRVSAWSRFDWLDHGFGDRFFSTPEDLRTLRQIHSDIPVQADQPGCAAEGDALLSSTPGLVVGVKTADCIPILLVDERQRIVAAVHAGWRGTASQIALKTVQAMNARPADLHAAIGPGIGPCCYEVGPEVAARFGIEGRAHIDLADINRRQLLSAGIERIYVAGLCTFCNADQFHSFRRDREAAGRMISFIGVRAAPPSRCETSAERDRSS
jgi:purine-nucleoside/S-methyl-5'-thioadenosine phosphorylase / adenosine deaminase